MSCKKNNRKFRIFTLHLIHKPNFTKPNFMETPDWKSNLGNLLSNKQIFRQDFIDKQAEAFCKNWAKYLCEFGSFRARYCLQFLNFDQSGIPDQLITKSFGVFVEYGSGLPYPFRLSILYKSNLELVFHYPTAIDMVCCRKNLIDNGVANRILEKEYEPECYKWKQDVHKGPEIHEEGYVLQIINERFNDWLNIMEKL